MNLWQRFRHMVVHRRLPLFWTVAVFGVVGPWVLHVPISADSNLANGRQTSCQVESVHDGDTMTLRCPGRGTVKVRLYCIDAPEMEQEPWGRRSRDYLRRIVGTEVQLVKHDTDRYGRVVAEVFSREENLNLAMVRAGWAAEYDDFCGELSYRKAERVARDGNRNIFSRRGLQRSPWEWRQRR